MIHAVGTALGEIIRNLRRTVRLTLYENRSRRAGTLLGRWWDLLSPLLQILIYWFVFSVGLGTQEKNGFPYRLWLMCGMMPWLALNSAILGASASIQQAASIIRNVRIPLSIIPMKAVVRAYYEHLWTMAILLIALLLGGVPVTWHYLELAYYLVASWVLLIGAALLTSSLTAAFRDFGELLPPLQRLVLYAFKRESFVVGKQRGCLFLVLFIRIITIISIFLSVISRSVVSGRIIFRSAVGISSRVVSSGVICRRALSRRGVCY